MSCPKVFSLVRTWKFGERGFKSSVCSRQAFQVRPLKQDDIPELTKLRQDMGVHDARSCIQTMSTVDPEGIWVAANRTGGILGACSAIKQTDDMHFLGLYCIREEFRGLNIGMQIWNACMSHVGKTNASLNAVPGKMEMYRDRSGFPTVETGWTCVKNYTTEPVDPKHLSSIVPQGVKIEAFNKSHLKHILDYDSTLVGYWREKALELSCQEENSKTLVAFKQGVCVGFGTIKTSCLGAGRVGPLYADDPAVAEVMLRSLILALPEATCFSMSTVSTNMPAKRFLEKLSCPQMTELIRMYRGEKMNVDTSKVFAVYDPNFSPF